MTSVSLRCWVNKYPLEGNKCLICWERSIPAHPAGSFPWPVMASQVANIWIVLLAPEMQYCSTVVRPPALHQRRRTDGGEQLLVARPAQLCPAFQKGHCRTRGATERPAARFPVLPCRALRHWQCGSLPEQLISPAPGGLVQARRCADTAAPLPLPPLAPGGDPSTALRCRV